MKSILLFLLLFFFSNVLVAQKKVTLRNLWTRPQVHVLFSGYTISFSIRDINRALEILNESGVHDYGSTVVLDTSKNYYVELFQSLHTVYNDSLQPIIQLGVGGYLLTGGHAMIFNKKHKPIKQIEVVLDAENMGEKYAHIRVYDPKKHYLLFTARMDVVMYNQDMGIDYY